MRNLGNCFGKEEIMENSPTEDESSTTLMSVEEKFRIVKSVGEECK
ncbi:hypothetical protein HanRHA438_Chr17g0791501 [Helianthus annuus]|uniref:Uncharacterized protein n=1 Tax=Helianthus annuus TaxID=4232 RepID=A0A9K3DEQ5_HELAN|nr:hypothetical protein HanXRQr2_Chr17g0780971 [Helianthus annuus]KAJ0427588.1 hypothetical protein HanHA300_Chr17g0636851 [Helianthus annuus]KAJ0431407.1 hypothetical protein HanIR_Chr17g0848031 [Helianthus annuus]KAJ0445871.1 hypothetical protein HanHA89_Chr17g0688151 [Helianthus annuus]KAJ0630837.1 hypothetical protein HanLR1_Chr17g0647551 [Helianthus annuus]